MDFTINENQNMIADMFQQFGKKNITPFLKLLLPGNFHFSEKKKKSAEISAPSIFQVS